MLYATGIHLGGPNGPRVTTSLAPRVRFTRGVTYSKWLSPVSTCPRVRFTLGVIKTAGTYRFRAYDSPRGLLYINPTSHPGVSLTARGARGYRSFSFAFSFSDRPGSATCLPLATNLTRAWGALLTRSVRHFLLFTLRRSSYVLLSCVLGFMARTFVPR